METPIVNGDRLDMTLDEDVRLLKEIPMFSQVETAKLKFLAFASNEVCFADGEALFYEGDPGDAAYIVIDGEADVMINGSGGEIPVARLGKHELVGEMAIMLNSPRSATVRAATKLTALEIPREVFMQVLTEFPQIAIAILKDLARRLERTTAQLREQFNARQD